MEQTDPNAAAAPAAPAKSKEKEQAEKERAEREKDFLNNILSSCLDQSARARLNTLALTRPETAQMVHSLSENLTHSLSLSLSLSSNSTCSL